jgi:GntR family transcriptional regulator
VQERHCECVSSSRRVSGVPLYEQIVEQVRQQIMAGKLAAGAALPSLRALAGELRVSLITTTRAYNDLAAEGLIVNVPGKGSFVAQIDPDEARRSGRGRGCGRSSLVPGTPGWSRWRS